MLMTHNPGSINFQEGDTRFSFLQSGDIYEFRHKDLLISGFIGALKEGSANNIWLRIYNNGAVNVFPLLGITSSSRLEQNRQGLRYSGRAAGVSYAVTFHPAPAAWFWEISLIGSGQRIDCLYGQDISLGTKQGVLENDLYIAQYLGHRIFYTDEGHTVCSRQNMDQNGLHPFLQQGTLYIKAEAYSTDAMQFFGPSFRCTGIPRGLCADAESRNLQSECSYIVLQSEKIHLNGEKRLIFYGFFIEDYQNTVERPVGAEEIWRPFPRQIEKGPYIPVGDYGVKREFGAPYSSPEWSEEAICSFFPERFLEERRDGKLLSFFTANHSHVAAAQKESFLERPHGNIIYTFPDREQVHNNLMTSTSYMCGIFNSQTAVGNTSKHKLLSQIRGPLDILKNSGQRIWVRIRGQYRLLLMPALFEMGLNYSRWFYVIENDILQITVFAPPENTSIITVLQSQKNRSYDYIITGQLVMGCHEFQQSLKIDEKDGELIILPVCNEGESPYPYLQYRISIPGVNFSWSDDRIFLNPETPQNGTLLTIRISQCNSFTMIMRGTTGETGKTCLKEPENLENAREQSLELFRLFMAGFYLESPHYNHEIAILNETAWWFTHNAMIHYGVPHGLEQPGGAAWGTRDISQGPLEFFLTTGNYSLVRAILLTVFSHQSAATGEWPQWFMFDRYADTADGSHGDVVFWPLKCLADYLEASRDLSVLEEILPYAQDSFEQKNTLLEHIKTAVTKIEERCIENTGLLSYAGGDWDDSLQPVNAEFAGNLVSSWTQALGFQTLKKLAGVLKSNDFSFASHLEFFAKKTADSFNEHCIINGETAGFIYKDKNGKFVPLLHSADSFTGIHSRLISLTRPIIANLVSPDQAKRNIDQIETTLHFPDGVRLMDRPVKYTGGVSRFFRRAEQAANVGREIGLLYVHAHIRYIEALCWLGEKTRAWDALFEINPIDLVSRLPHALPRQSNLYFSSSDGAFFDRYEFERDFDKLRDCSVKVKGGWRIYSSGPGIYFSCLVRSILGIRLLADALIIDPVLCTGVDGLRFHYICFELSRIFVYHIKNNEYRSIRVFQGNREIPSTKTENPYRNGGVCIEKNTLDLKNPEIHIWLD